MCKFLSALAFKDGSVYCDPGTTNSHEELILAKGLSDFDKSLFIRGWIRVEFSPEGDCRLDDPSAYVLKVDESSEPEWFDKAMRFQVEAELRNEIESMIVRDHREELSTGFWILTGQAVVSRLCGTAGVESMYDEAYVGSMNNEARVWSMRDKARVWSMRDKARVGSMYHEAYVGSMNDEARVRSMHDKASVWSIHDKARVENRS